MATRIALFSDVHANLPALAAVGEHIAHERYDGVYCLGDIGGYASEPNETQEYISAMGCAVVLGNYDAGVGFDEDDCGCSYKEPFDIAMSETSFAWTRAHTTPQNKALLRAFPREIRFAVEGKRVLLCHGSPRSTVEYLFENRSDGFLRQFTPGGKDDANADIICFGHTHVPFHRVVDGVHFVNTGSVGRPKDGDPRAGYCVLSIDGDSVSATPVRVSYDVETACDRLIAAGLPAYFADYLRTGGTVVAPESVS